MRQMTNYGVRLDGHVALVTGASGWIGAGIAKHMAAAGAKVAVHYHGNAEKAQKIVDEITAEGGTAAAFGADILNKEPIRVLIDDIRGKFGAVDILVNNALAYGVKGGAIEDQTWENFLGHLDFCVKAPLLLLQAVLPEMKARGWGRVINIGTEAFDLGNAKGSNYVAAKGAMLGITRSWANELGEFGITVNNVAPGWIAREGHGFENGEKTERRVDYEVGMPLKRVGTPDDIGATVTFVASEGASFITGQKIAVSGGKTLL
jgi:3-oxoacyl-[acyl-carrier protein] reductase